MTPLGPARDHFWLTIGMAKATGVDLTAALAEGRLTHEAYADVVTKCRQCPRPQQCRAEVACAKLDSAPAYCLNADVFADLARTPRR